MPFILALLAIAGGALFWLTRARNAAEVTSELADAAATVLGAARRFSFRHQANRHPVDCIEDPKIAIGGLATAFLELDAFPTADQKQRLHFALQSVLKLPLSEAEELVILGHWFVTQCGGASPAVSRLARRLNRLNGVEGLTRSLAVVQAMATPNTGGLTTQQTEALDEIRRIFRIT